MTQKRSQKRTRYRDPKPQPKRAPEAAKPTKWLDKTIGWNMHLEVLGRRLAEGRLNSTRIQAWLQGKYYPEALPHEKGQPRMVRFVPIPKK